MLRAIRFDWLKQVIAVFIMSLYIHDIMSLACDLNGASSDLPLNDISVKGGGEGGQVGELIFDFNQIDQKYATLLNMIDIARTVLLCL